MSGSSKFHTFLLLSVLFFQLITFEIRAEQTIKQKNIDQKIIGQTISFGSTESPPFWSQTLPENGICGEILYAISHEINLKSRLDFVPLKRIIENYTDNHVGDPGFFEGKQKFIAIIPIFFYRSSFFYYLPHQHYKPVVYQALSDLKGYTLGVLKGSIEDKQYFELEGIRVEESYTNESLFKKLKLKRIDLCWAIDLSGILIIDKLFPSEKAFFNHIEIPQSESVITLMIDINYPDGKNLGDKLKAGLQTIIKSGRYNEILKKYYGEINIPQDWNSQLENYEKHYQNTSEQEQ